MIKWTCLALLFFANLARAASAPSDGPAYRLHIPDLPADARVPLVVVLHGCATNARIIEYDSNWNALADTAHFVVLYPNLQKGRNSVRCWSWYDDDAQTRAGEENLAVMAAIQEAQSKAPIDPQQIFLTGISAGAAMVANLAACYPEVFAAVAMHSGMTYGIAHGWQNALKLAHDGPHSESAAGACNPADYTGRVMAIHGTADPMMNPKHSDRVIRDFIEGRADARKTRSQDFAADPNVFGGFRYSRTNYFKADNSLIGAKILVHGLGHAWSGGRPNLLSDPRGPRATIIMWKFFKNQKRAPSFTP
jgi:poly(hydroxyalkanoate) depolymerase family esterase